MAQKAEEVGIAKAKMGLSKTLVLSILAGAFIAFGAVFSTTATAGSIMSYGMTRVLGGLTFSLGLVLVIVGGAELFTGNNLIVMAWANKKVSTQLLLRNWLLVYAGNMIGALSIAVLIFLSQQYMFGKGAVLINVMNIALSKCQTGFIPGITLGILCNILVCLAVWLCYSAKTVTGKILSIIFPITAFVACGFEHCIANMYFVPLGMLIKLYGGEKADAVIEANGVNYDAINIPDFITNNLIPVTIGNMIGGAVLVGMVYWFVFLRKQRAR
jgi:formate/nitrite transporter